MQPTFIKDFENGVLTVTVEFAAPRKLVWAAWTRSEELDKWWAPQPWRCETISREFIPGGHWHYAMHGPDGERADGWSDYTAIENEVSFAGSDAFCDERGEKSTDIAPAAFVVTFADNGHDGTVVNMVTTYAVAEDMQKTLAMGLEEGLTLALQQLSDLLAS